MSPSVTSANGSPVAASLPPLPDLSAGGGTGAANGAGDGMAAAMAGVAPIKGAVDSILRACQQIVQSGVIPGAEQPCSQIVALAASLLPMAAQHLMQPGPVGPVGGTSPMGPVGSQQ